MRGRYTGTQGKSGEAGIKAERPPGNVRPADCKDKITESVFDKMLEKTQKEQTDIKKELFQNESVLNTEEKLDAQSQQWIDDISEYADIKELDANLLNRLISKIVISEPQEKDGTENYCRTPETVTMEIHFNLKPIPELGTIERGSGSHK